MAITIEAIYENGIFKPMQPLPLKEHERAGNQRFGVDYLSFITRHSLTLLS